MLFVRVLAAGLKPAFAVTALVGSAAVGIAGWQYWSGDSPTPFERVQSRGQLLLVSEFGRDADTIVAVDPADVSSRTEIARIGHAPEYGVFAVLSPDGQAIAYTALPEDTTQPRVDAPALVGIVEADGDVQVLADDVDLLITPVWTPDSTAVVARRNIPREGSAGSFQLVLLARDGARNLIASSDTASLFPVAFSPDGATLYAATLAPSGTDLLAIDVVAGSSRVVAHLSDEIARDWKLSPDGTEMTYAVAESRPPRVKAMTLDIATGAAREVTPGAPPRAEYSPVWSGDGEVVMAAVQPTGHAQAVEGGAAITETEGAIDLPIGWSPDGHLLAVRNIQGASPLDAGSSHVDLVTRDGDRQRVSPQADVLVVGWMESGGKP